MTSVKEEYVQLIETGIQYVIEGYGVTIYANRDYSCHNVVSTTAGYHINYTTSRNTYHIRQYDSYWSNDKTMTSVKNRQIQLTIKSIYDWKFDAVIREKDNRKAR